MPADPKNTYAELLALEGVTLDASRAAGVGELLRLQLEIERAATSALAFEAEPASFAVTLRDAAR